MKLASVAAALVVVGLCGNARADTPPSVWECAKSSEVADEYELHLSVQKRLVSAAFLEQGLRGASETERRLTRTLVDTERMRALGVLQAAGAATSKNPHLRFDLGEVYEALGDDGLRLEHHRRAAELLRGALAEFPDHARVDRAWLLLAFACGHIGDHPCELTAYHQVLRRETEELHRETPTLNLAETEMHQGDLREAIDSYRDAISLAGRMSSSHGAALAYFGLAVALDRVGDRIEAEKEAALALDVERSLGYRVFNPAERRVTGSILQSDKVFFVPVYEVAWYLGLEAIAAARKAPSTRVAATEWKMAERSFAFWVDGATKTGDRWLPIAKARLAQVKVELAKAEAAVANEPPKVHDDGGSKTLHL